MQLSENDPTVLSPAEPTYSLRLYVAGQTPKSVLAFTNLKRILGDLSNTERVLVGLDLRVRE